MIESIVWHTLILLLVYISIFKEESYEGSANPVNEIPVRGTWNSLEDVEEKTATCSNGKCSVDVAMQPLPEHRPQYSEFGPIQPTRRKKSKKHKRVKLTDGSSMNKRVKKKKSARRRSTKMNKIKKKVKVTGADKRKPFDITVHIKMDEVEK